MHVMNVDNIYMNIGIACFYFDCQVWARTDR